MTRSRDPIVVVGAGAVGCFFGGLLARAGHDVTLVGRAHHVEAITRDGLRLERGGTVERISVSASTTLDGVRHAALVLVAVKTPDTDAVARALAPLVPPHAAVMSLQNGVDNAERLRAALRGPVIPAAVYVAASMAGPGHVRHAGRGDLVIGDDRDTAAEDVPHAERLRELADTFEAAGIPCRVSARIAVELWTKLAINCAWNPVSALTRARYGTLIADVEARGVMETTVREVLAVARAQGIPLGDDVLDATWAIGSSMAAATSSTAQDLAAGRRTEIDALNGLVAARGEALGVPAPVNRTLWRLVKVLERAVLRGGAGNG